MQSNTFSAFRSRASKPILCDARIKAKPGLLLINPFSFYMPCSCDSYLESAAGEAQPQLPADHHGLHGSPAFAAHCPPHQRAVSLHQHFYTALIGITPPTEAELRT